MNSPPASRSTTSQPLRTSWKSSPTDLTEMPEGAEGTGTEMQLREMDEETTYIQQLRADEGPIVLINQFNVVTGDVERFLEVWAEDAAFMKHQPGFISTQLHRGTAGSTTFMNLAAW